MGDIMSDIDWSKAPEGFDYWIISTKNGATGGFYEKCVGNGNFRDINGDIWWSEFDISGGVVEVTKRPTEKWLGEGLPPVGITAYCTLTEENHLIVAHDIISSEKMALTCDNDGYWGADEHHWKPIQTEREKQRDEVVKLISESHTYSKLEQAIYDAGYRKA